MVLIEAACELGDGELGTRLASHFAPYATVPVMPSLAVMCLGPGERVLARVHDVSGRLDEAVEDFRAALRASRRVGCEPFAAIIQAELAAVLQRRGRPGDHEEAAALLGQAISMGRRMGLTGRLPAWERALAGMGDPSPASVAPRRGVLRRAGGQWDITLGQHSLSMPDGIGMRHLAALLARPDVEIPCVELSAGVGAPVAEPDRRPEPLLDRQAQRTIQQRLDQLDAELEFADAIGDSERSRRASAERHAIVDQLRRDVALGGRSRRMPDDAERCRTRVSKAIRRALGQISAIDPEVGGVLASRVRTGHKCSYDSHADAPIIWTVTRAVS
jgi:hypothetical protein